MTQEHAMDSNKLHPRPCIKSIHSPLLPGRPLLILPAGLLVRWPTRVPLPSLGDTYAGDTVRVPPDLRDRVQTLLFGTCPYARCKAARLLSDNKEHRKRILLRIYSRPYVQHMLAVADRLCAERQEQLQAKGESMRIRILADAAYAEPLEKAIGRRANQANRPVQKPFESK
jgi:hypothetical protein